MWALLQKETWGDHLTLKVLANICGVGIRVWYMETEEQMLQTHKIMPANDPDPAFLLEFSNLQETFLMLRSSFHSRIHLISVSSL